MLERDINEIDVEDNILDNQFDDLIDSLEIGQDNYKNIKTKCLLDNKKYLKDFKEKIDPNIIDTTDKTKDKIELKIKRAYTNLLYKNKIASELTDIYNKHLSNDSNGINQDSRSLSNFSYLLGSKKYEELDTDQFVDSLSKLILSFVKYPQIVGREKKGIKYVENQKNLVSPYLDMFNEFYSKDLSRILAKYDYEIDFE